MDIAIPHDLGREEVRRRLRANAGRIGEAVPGGMAEISTSWPGEDRMAIAIAVMGQTMEGEVEIADTEIRFRLDLPLALMFIGPMVESAVREAGPKLLAPAS